MTHAPAHITRRAGVYIYRRRIPEDVRHGAFFGGKNHYQVSLRTGVLLDARAKSVAIGIRFDAEVANLRAGSINAKALVAGRDYVLSADALDAIQAKWFSAGQKRDQERRSMAHSDPDGEWAHQLEGEDDRLHHLMAQIGDPVGGRHALQQLKVGLQEEWSSHIAVEARRWGVARHSDDYRRIEEAIINAEIDVLKVSHMGWGGLQQEPTSQAIKRGLTRLLKPESGWTIQQLANRVLEVAPKGASWRHKVLEQVLPLFVSHLGAPRPISDIRSSDIRSFIEGLRQCPTNSSQRFPGKGLREAIELNRARVTPYPTLKPNTIRDTHYAVIRSLLGYALEQEWISVSPADRVKVPGASKRGGRRPSFKEEELNALFQLPVFVGCASSTHYGVSGSVKLDDHRYWTPLVMLFSGIRPSEVGQLAVSDVKHTSRIPFISILTEFDPDDPEDAAFYVTEKTANARREVPIHPMLLDLGFGAYVERMKDAGSARLFPDWVRSADARKLFSGARWIRKFNEEFIPLCSQRHPRPTFYSLRHTFKVAMASQGIYPAIQNQILGHANAGMDAHYFDEVSLEQLAEQLARVDYRHLDLSHLLHRTKS